MPNLTIKDIARISGCSVSTISRVINDRPDVRPETKEHVLKVMREAGFVPNTNARQLKIQQSRSLVFVVKGTRNLFFSDFLVQLQRAATLYGYNGIVSYLDENANEIDAAEKILREIKPKGMIFLGGSVANFKKGFANITVPSVLTTLVSDELDFPNLSMVGVDDRAAAYTAVDYLIQQGHRKIAVLGGPVTSYPSVMRREGAQQALQEQPMESVDVRDVDLTFVGSVTLTEIYAYMSYLSRDRVLHPNSDRSAKGLNPTSRARKLATIRSFYGYLCNKVHRLDRNPVKDIDAPKLKKTLPRYLTLDESISLLESVDGPNRERDLCILTLFLNCGLRISELIGLNLSDVHEDALRVLGKGNKVRMVYLNQACLDTLRDYLAVRRPITGPDRDALFLSARSQRISRSMVNALVKKHLSQAGLDSTQYSSHKLRHTAATLMYQNGVDVRTLKEVLGHENLNTTMIYTHVTDENMKQAALHSPLAHFSPPPKKEEDGGENSEDHQEKT